MALEGIHGLYPGTMSRSGSFTFNSNRCDNRLNWNRHGCGGERNPANDPPGDLLITATAYLTDL